MIDLSVKTFTNILSDMLSRVSVELNKRDGSLIKTSLSAAAWAIEGLYLELAYIQRQAYGLYATGEYLDYKVAEAGLSRKQATPTIRYARFNIQPNIGTKFKVAEIENNIYFTLTSTATNQPDPNYPTAPYIGLVTCDEAGTVGNITNATLVTVGFISGLTTALLLDISIPGSNQESDAALRERYKLAVGRIEFGGNIAAYRNFLLEQDGVGAVQVYPIWNGPGTVLCSVVDNDYLPVSSDKLAELQMILCPPDESGTIPSENGYGMAPIGAIATVTTAVSVPITIYAQIRLRTHTTTTIQEVQEQAEKEIKEYLRNVCAEWGTMGSWRSAEYYTIVYYNKISGILNSIPGVLVANNVLLNGGTSDLELIEQGTINGQQVPVFDSLTLVEI